MNKENNSSIIIMIVILSLCVLGLTGYIIYDKFNEKTNSDESITTTTTLKQEEVNKNEKLYKSNIEQCDKEMCSEKIGDLNIKFYPLRNGMESTLSINEKEILTDIYSLNNLYILDDTIIVITSDTDIRTTKIYLFDKFGNKQKEIFELDNNYQEMVIADYHDAIIINEDKIILEGTRLTHGPSLATYYYDNSLIMEDYYLGKCDIYNKYIEEIIYGTYEIDYLGNNKFSEIKNISYTKLKDSDITCNN